MNRHGLNSLMVAVITLRPKGQCVPGVAPSATATAIAALTAREHRKIALGISPDQLIWSKLAYIAPRPVAERRACSMHNSNVDDIVVGFDRPHKHL